MPPTFPEGIESTDWSKLSDEERDFFCFREDYLPLPAAHEQRIHKLTPQSSELLWRWFSPSFPPDWLETKPHFSNQIDLSLTQESWSTESGIQEVRQWLHGLNIPYSSDVFLVYEANQIIRMPWKLVVKYWNALAWSVGYSMIAIDQTRQWACCFHHEDWIVFGKFS